MPTPTASQPDPQWYIAKMRDLYDRDPQLLDPLLARLFLHRVRSPAAARQASPHPRGRSRDARAGLAQRARRGLGPHRSRDPRIGHATDPRHRGGRSARTGGAHARRLRHALRPAARPARRARRGHQPLHAPTARARGLHALPGRPHPGRAPRLEVRRPRDRQAHGGLAVHPHGHLPAPDPRQAPHRKPGPHQRPPGAHRRRQGLLHAPHRLRAGGGAVRDARPQRALHPRGRQARRRTARAHRLRPGHRRGRRAGQSLPQGPGHPRRRHPDLLRVRRRLPGPRRARPHRNADNRGLPGRLCHPHEPRHARHHAPRCRASWSVRASSSAWAPPTTRPNSAASPPSGWRHSASARRCTSPPPTTTASSRARRRAASWAWSTRSCRAATASTSASSRPCTCPRAPTRGRPTTSTTQTAKRASPRASRNSSTPTARADTWRPTRTRWPTACAATPTWTSPPTA